MLLPYASLHLPLHDFQGSVHVRQIRLLVEQGAEVLDLDAQEELLGHSVELGLYEGVKGVEVGDGRPVLL